MNYDIKILGEDEDNGLLEFDQLNLLTKSIKDIATKALMFRLRGFSDISPDKNLRRPWKCDCKAFREADKKAIH